MKRMVELITPLGIDSIPSSLPARHNSRIVQIALSNQREVFAQLGGKSLHFPRHIFEEMKCRVIDEGVYSVKPKAVEMVVAQPHERVINEESAYFVASVAIEIHGGAPRRLVLLGVIRSEAAQIVPNRTEVVINHVEQHRDSLFMTGIHETFQIIGTAIRVLRC